MLVDQLATDSPITWLAFSPATMHVAVRSTLPLETLAPIIGRVVRQVDPTFPVARMREMDHVFTESIRRPRLLAQLLTVFSTLALLLAAIGTYGVLAFMVTERRREIGVRLALGADQARLLREVMGQGLRPVAIGIAIGLAGALGVTRFFEISALRRATGRCHDPGDSDCDGGRNGRAGVLAAGVARVAVGSQCRFARRVEVQVEDGPATYDRG